MSTYACVLLADVVRSSAFPDFPAKRDEALEALSRNHELQDCIEDAYAITAWDEFQVVIPRLPHLPNVLWDIRKAFLPLKVRVGVGAGEVERHGSGPVNVTGAGEAFIRARRALEGVRARQGPRHPALTYSRTGRQGVDLILNSVLPLVDLITERITASQWKAIVAFEELGRQDQVAAVLGKDRSTVSRALNRSGYWAVRDSLNALREILHEQFSDTLSPEEPTKDDP